MKTSFPKTLRAWLWRARRRRKCVAEDPPAVPEQRVTAQGDRIDVAMLRSFLRRALEDDAVTDAVNDLLFEHIVVGSVCASVLAESLPSYISEILDAATHEDWRAVADELVAEAREVNGEV